MMTSNTTRTKPHITTVIHILRIEHIVRIIYNSRIIHIATSIGNQRRVKNILHIFPSLGRIKYVLSIEP